ncbi:Emopamil-binding protein [Venturia nashicola]|uniref:Emopamil-binding protein n=1 Tax=Venturia nashicola TaxID=86259 RepID=A0A4Z1NIX0_9PEZI|nr:Emopamil-binding protein [Venturia nashicola]TLD20785.1 Emopamil-binding protein [Venturia nashicola]
MAGGPVIDEATIGGLSAALGLLITASIASRLALPKAASTRTRILFVWHSFDSLIHFIFEGSFLYNCFNVYLSTKDIAKHTYLIGKAPVQLYPAGVYFLGHKDRIYGSAYGTSPTAKLWQEYAKADARWGGADLTVVSLELLTVLIGGPLSAYICYLMAKGHGDVGAASASGKKAMGGKLSFWMIVLATGELYGGFMTFVPEWLSGSPNLDTSNFMYLYVYLAFFNLLWVFLPLYALKHSYTSLTTSSPLNRTTESANGKKTI